MYGDIGTSPLYMLRTAFTGEHGLDLAAISGTGPQGRVLKADVQAALDLGRAPEPVNAPRAKLVPLPSAGEEI